MKRALLIIAASAAMMAPAYAAMTNEQCQAAWVTADINKDGALDAAESARYAASLRIVNKPMADGVALNQTAFLDNCKAGYFDIAAVDAGAPLEGANSFTEGQAKDRVLAAGFVAVSALNKDAKGIWRGTVESQGKKLSVAVDFKGNVVTSNM